MDLQMEFFNREYKESVKDAAGQLTEATIARHSQMVSVGKALTFVYDQNVASRPSHTRSSGKVDRDKDIRDMIELLHPDDLFSVKPRTLS
ncbi:hypothetical protein KUTeg_001267 [Tegillarca granosa]|uniref:Uncharacterized protein n=1 Tax=Tegillarca granosa TaxID=220873 RepID=A0ABQ9FV51_TEGGR|nr:hypothetical protein KUTeg_001267 [Tegillarca granosa]